MSNVHLVKSEKIQNKIYTIRGCQVMIDNDLAALYQVETKYLNRAVKRNIERFPETFRFQLSEEETAKMQSQIVTGSKNNLRFQNGTSSSHGGRRYLPFAFTEQGVAMLSAVLRSETAVKVSIRIIEAFVAMRRFMLTNAQVFQRLDTLEVKQIESDKKIDKVLTAIEMKDITPKQGIFFDGQIFDAYKFVAGLVRKANKSILLIDNYIDDKDVYHFGASLKDLGKKWFAFSKMDKTAFELMANLKKVIVDE